MASEISKGLARNRGAGRRDHSEADPARQAAARAFRSMFGRGIFLAKPVPTAPRAERRLLSHSLTRPKMLRAVAETRIAICRASVRSEDHIWSGVTDGSAAAASRSGS